MVYRRLSLVIVHYVPPYSFATDRLHQLNRSIPYLSSLTCCGQVLVWMLSEVLVKCGNCVTATIWNIRFGIPLRYLGWKTRHRLSSRSRFSRRNSSATVPGFHGTQRLSWLWVCSTVLFGKKLNGQDSLLKPSWITGLDVSVIFIESMVKMTQPELS